MPFPTTTPNKDPKKVWTNADLKPYPNLRIEVEGGANERPRMSPQEEAYLRGDDINGGMSIDQVLADSKAAMASFDKLKGETDAVGAAVNRDRNSSIRPLTTRERIYHEVDNAIDPQVKQLGRMALPLAMMVSGPIGTGAGALMSADAAFEAGRPNASASDVVLNSIIAAAGLPRGVRQGAAVMMGKPTAAEASAAAQSAATRKSVADARRMTGYGMSRESASRMAMTPGSRGPQSATNINQNATLIEPERGMTSSRIIPPENAFNVSRRVKQMRGDAKAKEYIGDIWGPGGEGIPVRQGAPATPKPTAASTVPVHKDLRNVPESVYQRDLELLGGQQGSIYDQRANATDRRIVPGGVDESTYQFLLKMLGGRGDDVAAAASSANTAARAEQAARVPGGFKPLGENRAPRRGSGVQQEVAPRPKRRADKPDSLKSLKKKTEK